MNNQNIEHKINSNQETIKVRSLAEYVNVITGLRGMNGIEVIAI